MAKRGRSPWHLLAIIEIGRIKYLVRRGGGSEGKGKRLVVTLLGAPQFTRRIAVTPWLSNCGCG